MVVVMNVVGLVVEVDSARLSVFSVHGIRYIIIEELLALNGLKLSCTPFDRHNVG